MINQKKKRDVNGVIRESTRLYAWSPIYYFVSSCLISSCLGLSHLVLSDPAEDENINGDNIEELHDEVGVGVQGDIDINGIY